MGDTIKELDGIKVMSTAHLIDLVKDRRDQTVPVVVERRKDVYLVNKHSYKNLNKRIPDLREMKMIELDVAKAKRLEIVDGKNH